MIGRDETDVDDTDVDGTRDQTGADRTRSAAASRDRVDPLSLVVGLVFVAVALAVLVESFWLEIDPVLVAGGAVAAAGTAMIVATVLRHRRREQPDEGLG